MGALGNELFRAVVLQAQAERVAGLELEVPVPRTKSPPGHECSGNGQGFVATLPRCHCQYWSSAIGSLRPPI